MTHLQYGKVNRYQKPSSSHSMIIVGCIKLFQYPKTLLSVPHDNRNQIVGLMYTKQSIRSSHVTTLCCLNRFKVHLK